jgi:hypothetical protein
LNSDEEFAASIRYMAESVDKFRSVLLDSIITNRHVDPETRKLLREVADAVFSTLHRLFSLTAYNAENIRNLEEALERLPRSQVSNELMQAFRDAVKVNESQRQFIEKGKRYFDDMKKDIEKT